MKKIIPLLVVTCLCLIPASCTRTPAPANDSQPSPVADARPSPSPPVAASSTTREAGDTAADQFTGTVAVSEQRRLQGSPVELRQIRTAAHPEFDRVVFEFAGNKVPGYRIEYVKAPVAACAGEEAVKVTGKGLLSVQIMPARAHTEAGIATVKERQYLPALAVLKEMKSACDFESEVTWVLGLSDKKPYRVLELDKPARLVIDVHH